MRLQPVAFCLLVLLTATTADAGPPQRVVSIDYCADQYVLKMLPRAQILAVSPDAGEPFSYMRDSAAGLRRVRPVAEDILALEPDLIVRSYGGGPHALRFFARAGIDVLQVPYVNDIGAIRAATRTIADGLGVPERGEAIVAEMDRRLHAVARSAPAGTALYMTPTGVTSGPGTLIDDMLRAAGLVNFERRVGWHPLPLERLAYEQPEVVAGAFFSAGTDHPSKWSAMRHPVARRQMSERTTVLLQGAWTSCGGWFLLDAIEALAGR